MSGFGIKRADSDSDTPKKKAKGKKGQKRRSSQSSKGPTRRLSRKSCPAVSDSDDEAPESASAEKQILEQTKKLTASAKELSSLRSLDILKKNIPKPELDGKIKEAESVQGNAETLLQALSPDSVGRDALTMNLDMLTSEIGRVLLVRSVVDKIKKNNVVSQVLDGNISEELLKSCPHFCEQGFEEIVNLLSGKLQEYSYLQSLQFLSMSSQSEGLNLGRMIFARSKSTDTPNDAEIMKSPIYHKMLAVQRENIGKFYDTFRTVKNVTEVKPFIPAGMNLPAVLKTIPLIG